MKTMKWIYGVFGLLMILLIGSVMTSQASSGLIVKPPGTYVSVSLINISTMTADLPGESWSALSTNNPGFRPADDPYKDYICVSALMWSERTKGITYKSEFMFGHTSYSPVNPFYHKTYPAINPVARNGSIQRQAIA